MRILFASSEIYPYAKTGGLADVADSLPLALNRYMEMFRVMPLYSFMKNNSFKVYDSFTLSLEKTEHLIEILTKTEDKITTYFIKTPILSDTKNIYGDENGDYQNNHLRFALFCKAIVELSIRLKIKLLHLNDWHTALTSLFIRELKLNIKTVFTIHNLAYQGLFDKKVLKELDISEQYFKMDGLEFYNKVNFLKAGIAYSDTITTVSPTYAKEILTPEFGCGLDGFLEYHKNKLSGILNGVNCDLFNPAKDKSLPFIFDKGSLENKHKNKIAFIKNSKLKDPRAPLLVMVTRLVEQKGIDLLLKSVNELLSKKINLCIIGEGDQEISKKLNDLASHHKNFEFFEGYNEKLSHLIYASSDFLLMPSVFEPSGLNQFIAMRYGSFPIVHKVGGLKDSVHENSSVCGNGFVYNKQIKKEFLLCIERALEYKKDKKRFTKMIKSNMECDFSFEKSALKYLKIYKSLI